MPLGPGVPFAGGRPNVLHCGPSISTSRLLGSAPSSRWVSAPAAPRCLLAGPRCLLRLFTPCWEDDEAGRRPHTALCAPLAAHDRHQLLGRSNSVGEAGGRSGGSWQGCHEPCAQPGRALPQLLPLQRCSGASAASKYAAPAAAALLGMLPRILAPP